MSCAKSQIDVLASLVHPRDGHPKIFAMLEAYFDESGIETHSPVCVVAGYYAGENEWRRFEIKWKKILLQEGIEEFHSVRFWGRDQDGNRVKPFELWTDDRAAKFLERLIGSIETSRMFPVMHAAVVADWFKVSLAERRFLTGGNLRKAGSGCPNKPYFMPFQFCVIEPIKHCRAPEKVHFFFGLDSNFAGYALNFYKYIQNHAFTNNPECYGNCDFPKSKETPELQAADLLAYLLWQFQVSNIAKQATAPDRASMITRLLKHARQKQPLLIFNTDLLHKTILACHQRERELIAWGAIKFGKARVSRQLKAARKDNKKGI